MSIHKIEYFPLRILILYSCLENLTTHIIHIADTLRLPRDLIRGLFYMVQALDCGLPLDPAKFMAHTAQVNTMFYQLAPWVTMWPSLHKVNMIVESQGWVITTRSRKLFSCTKNVC